MKIMTFNTQHCLNYITNEIDFETMELFYIERDVICEGLCNIERTIDHYNQLLRKIDGEVN